MKVLTGSLRGRTLIFEPDPQLRPTADKARKAVFDMLQGALEGRRVLDLFSGTGAMGYEALSNGAAEVEFVEQSRAQCKKIEANLAKLGIGSQARVHAADAVEWVKRLRHAFDIIFLDPPYDTPLVMHALEAIATNDKALVPGGFVVVEGRYTEDVPDEIGNLRQVRQKLYGQTKMTVYATRPGSREGR
jgi:16S rRNA (guanine966-N2)-methyltransferase